MWLQVQDTWCSLLHLKWKQERKRHTARRVASTRYAVPVGISPPPAFRSQVRTGKGGVPPFHVRMGGGYPIQSWWGVGYPIPGQDGVGYPIESWQGVSQSSLVGWVPPVKKNGGSAPSSGWGTPISQMWVPLSTRWGYSPISWMGVPLCWLDGGTHSWSARWGVPHQLDGVLPPHQPDGVPPCWLDGGTPPPGFIPLLEIRENWKTFFQSGKSQGIWQFFKKSGKNQGILITQYFFYTFHNFSCVLGLCLLSCTFGATLTSQQKYLCSYVEQESPPAWTQEAYHPPRSHSNFLLLWGEGGPLTKKFFPVWTCIKPNLVSKFFPFTGGGGGGESLDKKNFPQSEHVSSQIWCQKFFPLPRGGPSKKIFFPSLNMYQAKSGVKNCSLNWGGGSLDKIFFSGLNLYQAKSGVKNISLYWDQVPPPPPENLRPGTPPDNLRLGTPPEKLRLGTPPENLRLGPPPKNLRPGPLPPENLRPGPGTTPPPPKCGQTENITFRHPSDGGRE